MPKLTPKGMRDFLPEEMIHRKEVMEVIGTIFAKYGFAPIDTPALEYVDTLKAKAGEAIKREIFLIEGKEYGMRFDLTVPFSRMIANTAYAKPFKRSCMGPVWRHEEPQKGRYREFWQCDIDTIGCKSVKAEAEILQCVYEIVTTLGFEKPKILINNRKIMNGLAEKLGVNEKIDELLRIIDKMDKIGESGVREHLKEHFEQKVIDEVFRLIKTTGSNKEKLKAAHGLSQEGAQELEEILALTAGINIELDLSLVRGLGYYTGPVFEVKLSEELGSCAGGGRYDNLLGIYGQADYATGISFGLERLLYLLKERKKETQKTFTKVFIAPVKPELYQEAQKLTQELRHAGIPSEIDLNERNLKKQLEYVNSMGIPYVLIVGARELEEKVFSLKDMRTGKEERSALSEILILLQKEFYVR